MPFKSEKQRRWVHANKPGMARRWEEEEGGHAGGGLIPSEETIKRSIRENTGYKELSHMRAGGIVGNGSPAPLGVERFDDQVRRKCKES